MIKEDIKALYIIMGVTILVFGVLIRIPPILGALLAVEWFASVFLFIFSITNDDFKAIEILATLGLVVLCLIQSIIAFAQAKINTKKKGKSLNYEIRQ